MRCDELRWTLAVTGVVVLLFGWIWWRGSRAEWHDTRTRALNPRLGDGGNAGHQQGYLTGG